MYYIYGFIGEIWLIDLPMVRFTVLLAQVPKKNPSTQRGSFILVEPEVSKLFMVEVQK